MHLDCMPDTATLLPFRHCAMALVPGRFKSCPVDNLIGRVDGCGRDWVCRIVRTFNRKQGVKKSSMGDKHDA
jgi:hypothetical protein